MNSSEESFAIWYSIYPRHESRKDALKAWLRLKPDDQLIRTLIDAVEVQREYLWHDREIRFIPLPATWLRGEKWTDEIPDWKPVSSQDREVDAMLFPGGRDQYRGRY